MSVFLISDTHFFHANILLPEYEERPFKDIDDMNSSIVENWNSVVTNDDYVLHLGDFAFGRRDQAEDIMSLLNGNISIVLGNHDRRGINWFKRCGFKNVFPNPIIISNRFVFSHAPYDELPDGMINVHGHIHSGKHRKEPLNHDVYKCVCVEQINYTPILLQEIINDNENAVLQLLS